MCVNLNLQRGGRVRNDISCVPERPARLVLALRRDHLRPRVAGSLGLGGHGAHQLLGHPDILHLDNRLRHIIINVVDVTICDMTTSTLSTVTPQGSVASCSRSCISLAMASRPSSIP